VIAARDEAEGSACSRRCSQSRASFAILPTLHAALEVDRDAAADPLPERTFSTGDFSKALAAGRARIRRAIAYSDHPPWMAETKTDAFIESCRFKRIERTGERSGELCVSDGLTLSSPPQQITVAFWTVFSVEHLLLRHSHR